MGWLRSALRWAWRSVALILILALLATNVLAFTSSAFVSTVSRLASVAGLTTVHARNAAAATQQAVERRAVVKRLGQRTARGAARSFGGVATQSLPFVGWGFVLALTAWEVRDYCATLDDLRALDPLDDLDAYSVCGMEPMTAEALRDRLGLPSRIWIPSEAEVAAKLGLSSADTAPPAEP